MNVHATERTTGDEPGFEVEAIPTPEREATKINSLLERVAGASMKEIDDVVADLGNLRTFLGSESKRLQRELTNFNELNMAALRATKTIVEGLPKSGVSTPREQQGLLETLRRAPAPVR